MKYDPFDIDWEKHEDFFSSPFGPIHNESAQNAAQMGKRGSNSLMDAWKEIHNYINGNSTGSLTLAKKTNNK